MKTTEVSLRDVKLAMRTPVHALSAIPVSACGLALPRVHRLQPQQTAIQIFIRDVRRSKVEENVKYRLYHSIYDELSFV